MSEQRKGIGRPGKALEMAKRKAAQNGLFDLFCQCVENGHESAVDYILKKCDI